MEFKILGPFTIDLDEYGNIPTAMKKFWQRVDEVCDGLSRARGCYVFGVQSSGGPKIKPWYIGKTNNQSFEGECFKPHQRNHYSRAISRYRRKRPCLFLLPALTKSKKQFSRNRNAGTIDFVETYLIDLGLRANEELLNKRDTKLYREVVIPGFLNAGNGNPGRAAKRLRKSMSF